MSDFGIFSENPICEWLVDLPGEDRNMRLTRDFWYLDPDGRKWHAPENSVINGASIPRALWSSVGSPYTDDYRRASVVHDIACSDPTIVRKEADNMFYYACLAGGCSYRQSKLLYAGVRIGAWSDSTLNTYALSKDTLLFRVPQQTSPEEVFLQIKFQEIGSELLKIRDDASIAELDEIIDRHL